MLCILIRSMPSFSVTLFLNKLTTFISTFIFIYLEKEEK